MKELVSKIQEVYATFSTDAALQIEKGNKAAGTRARKTSLELEKLMKEFRKVSLEESKKLPLHVRSLSHNAGSSADAA